MKGDRSRSPNRPKDSEWIARAICQFGRYSQKRPKNIWVDAAGGMLVEDIMEHWGNYHGISEQDVIKAIQKHMFHEEGGMRFSLVPAEDGRIVVRVLPKRHAKVQVRQQESWQAPLGSWSRDAHAFWNTWNQTPKKAPSNPNPKTLRSHPDVNTELLKKCPWNDPSGGLASSNMRSKTTPEKIDSSLDDLIKTERNSRCHEKEHGRQLASSSSSSSSVTWKLNSPLSQSIELAAPIGPTPPTTPPPQTAAPQLLPSSAEYGKGRPKPQHVWAELQPHGKEFGKGKRGKGKNAGWQKASGVHQQQFSTGQKQSKSRAPAEWKKIRKGDSRPASRKATPEASTGLDRLDRERRGRRSGSSESHSSRGSNKDRNAEDEELAELARSGLDLAAPPQPRLYENAPEIPPGPHWTEYKDDDVIWYYYEGPLGKWWYHENMPENCPEPYCDQPE